VIAVPVILIFTKFESQEAVAFKKLIQQCSAEEALSRAAQQARHDFEETYLTRFKDRKYGPKEILYLKGMSSPAQPHRTLTTFFMDKIWTKRVQIAQRSLN
jgi:hypothetical protein